MRHGAPVRTGPDQAEFDKSIGAILNRHPAVGLALGIVGSGGIELFESHGMADIEKGTR